MSYSASLARALNTHLACVFPTEAFFGIYTSEEVKKISVVKVISPNSFNILGHPLPGGLYDPQLGPCERSSNPCSTCGQSAFKCSGHTGHIELPLPVVNPLFHKKIFDILSVSCFHCFKILIPAKDKALLVCQLSLLNAGFISEASNLELHVCQKSNHTIDSYPPDLFLDFMANGLDAYLKELTASTKNLNVNESYKGYDIEISKVFKNATQKIDKRLKQCLFCKNDLQLITCSGSKIMSSTRKRNNTTNPVDKVIRSGQVLLSPSEIRNLILNIWASDTDLMKELIPVLKRNKCQYPTDALFLDVVLVTPGNMRPINVIRGSPVEHPANKIYKSIINNCVLLRSILVVAKNAEGVPEDIISLTNRARGNTPEEKLQVAWHELQSSVDALLLGRIVQGNPTNSWNGLKQIIEKKEGIIRMNMMGKRVNFAARSVITPDPNLDINEIGFPETFAKVLTYPVPVTPWNVVELRQLVKNGPNIHPGAVAIVSENGKINKISEKDHVQRESLANRLLTPEETAKGGKVVLRHLMNGDVLLANRQPTLHKPSIMAHKARILKGEKTLRLHYANCKSYNADFDGDEMNTHFAQNEVARSEAYNIVNVTKQYLVPKDGTPLSGLIQDHVIAGVHLTLRGKFFDRETYMHLVYQALSFKLDAIKIVPPAMLKPKMLWSGKQVISTIILNLTPKGKYPLNLVSSAKISVKAWGNLKFNSTLLKNPKTMTESEIIIRKGRLLSGVIDKTHCGATSYGLIHSFYELYGGEASSQLLSSFSKLFTCFLQFEGFTLDVKDILVKSAADKERSKIIQEVRKVGPLVAAAAVGLPADADIERINDKVEASYRQVPNFSAIIDREYKTTLDSFTNSINSTCLPRGLLEEFPCNNLQLMVQSGAKGSTVNTMQISCLLGQIELEGKRPPLMISGRSLPSFKPFDTSPRAGGFIDGRFMTGIQPQEFFFHCMAGREGLIDTAVKTSRSGYLQRCLIKHLEGLVVNYDMTVRDSDGSVIQWLYGEDGLDVCKSQYFKPNLIQFLEDNEESIVDKSVVKMLKKQSDQTPIKSLAKEVKKWRKNSGEKQISYQAFPKFSRDVREKLSSDFSSRILEKFGRTELNLITCEKWKDSDKNTKQKYLKLGAPCPDPVVSKYLPGSHFGSVSEKLEKLIDDFLESRPLLSKSRRKSIRDMVNFKTMVSTCPPGEPVGVLAAQSIGEPSTQMTLNTFHFAGRGEMNVTLGVPRLREILTLATKHVKTPCVDIPFLLSDNPKKLKKKAEKLRKNMTKVTLADVLEHINVSENLDLQPYRHLKYELHMQFLPRKAYKDKTNVKPKDILKHVEKRFLKELTINILKVSKVKSALIHENLIKAAKPSTNNNDPDENAEDKSEEASRVLEKKKLDLDSDSSGESEGEEEDAVSSKKKVLKKETQYDEPEEGDKDPLLVDDDDDEEFIKSDEKLDEGARETSVLDQYEFVRKYRFDTKNELWCNVILWLPLSCQRMDFSSMIKKIASSSVIYEVHDIKRAITYENNQKLYLKTDGINMQEMFSYCDILDINKLYCNDIHCIAQTYGIEAAAKVIVKEVQNVFQVYGIFVDPRHLLLVADYMTFDGTYAPMNRKGIELNPSPFQQMSFECSLNFLKNAAITGKTDMLKSPSSRLIVGKHCHIGTAMLDTLIKI